VNHSKSLDDLERLMRPSSALVYNDPARLITDAPPIVDVPLQPPRRRNSHHPRAGSRESGDSSETNDDLSSSSQNRRSSSRRHSLSKVSDHDRMKEALQAVNEYRADVDESLSADFCMDDLKEHLISPNRKNLKPKLPRRLSSFSSDGSGKLGDSGMAKSIDPLSNDHNQSMDVTDLERVAASRENNKSSQTLPVGNVVKTEREKKRKHQIKKDQLIESIVWFSFHIPRTVLEDLIAHEMALWNRNNAQKRTSRRKRADSTRSIKADNVATGDNGEEDDGSVSSLSEEGGGPLERGVAASHSGMLTRSEQHGGHNNSDMIRLPKAVERESAILFVDMSGFTKLSTLLDVESLSKVINSYFDMIVSEVILFGGDILKFAGDAFFAEWRVVEEPGTENDGNDNALNPLSELNASLVSINEMVWDDIDMPPLSNCVMMAAKCATSIVKKFSDYHVTTADSRNTNEAMLNVHCGIGVGRMVGLHVRDYKEGQEEEAVELRREFLILGDPIDQVRHGGRSMCQIIVRMALSHALRLPVSILA
jgi:class 3 adenylate cyclase